ncbi:MAG: hypothetical protein QF357_06675 [Dehalococcoidia bacterium]|nr:hypothetical protein [Dehalococcoidia bacterium]
MLQLKVLTWLRFALVVLLVVLLATAVACSGDDDEDDEEYYEDDAPTQQAGDTGETQPTATSAPADSTGEAATSPTATSQPTGGEPAVGPGPPIRPPEAGDLQIMGLFDVVLADLATGQSQFELEVENQFGENPMATLESVGDFTDPLALLRQNFAWLSEQGYSAIELFAAEGYGTAWMSSPTLTAMRHDGVDYDSQYSGGELNVDEDEAYQRYYGVGTIFADTVAIAHEFGFSVTANIESIAHIIGRATGEGIGGSSGALTLAGRLPAPTPNQVLAFIDEILATGVDSVSAEAYSSEYEKAIEGHLESKGVPYLRAGADVGTVWTGYYYSFYPENEQIHDIHEFVYTTDSFLGVTNGTIFARARAMAKQPGLALTVGAYNPLPCDPDKSLADVRIPVDVDHPVFIDGSPLESCSTGPWRNLILAAARMQGVSRVVLAADLADSIKAATTPGIARSIQERVAAHPAVDDNWPIANVIYDLPDAGPDSDLTRDGMLEAIVFSVSGLVDDALSAVGYTTVLTYDEVYPGADLVYIVTAGGGEETDDENGQGPPYWTDFQGMEPGLVKLLDPAEFSGPVFVHPLFGIPEGGNWAEIRPQLGLPPRFAFTNPVIMEGYKTSLVSSLNITSDGDIDDSKPPIKLVADTGRVLGREVSLVPFGDFYPLGQTLHVASESEFTGDGPRVIAPVLAPTARGGPEDGVVLAGDGNGRFIWLTNQLHHEAFSWIVGQMIAETTGEAAVLAAPAKAHVWSGRQTMAIAYADTTLELNLPFAAGDRIDITVYDVRSDLVSEELGVTYDGPVSVELKKWSLVVIEPARD